MLTVIFSDLGSSVTTVCARSADTYSGLWQTPCAPIAEYPWNILRETQTQPSSTNDEMDGIGYLYHARRGGLPARRDDVQHVSNPQRYDQSFVTRCRRGERVGVPAESV